VALLTGYRSEDNRTYFGNGSSQGVRISYSEDKLDLTGSLNAVGSRAVGRCDELLIYYGDILTDLDVTGLLETHRKTRADVTLVLDRGYSLPVGVAEVKEGLVTSFREKPNIALSVTTGPMVVGPDAMALMKKFAGRSKPDLMTDFVPEMIRRGGKVGAFYTEKEWFDVGTVSSFVKLDEELAKHPLSYVGLSR
ncbi:MAG: hypothetical protein JRN16_06915, partial [Nitrososphaerota archaeon]|nr:hypothetical protein [Nitrososphaerota archaeon]